MAAIGSSAQRSTSTPSVRANAVVRRRLVVGILCVLSLALVTVYFRESDGGFLHSVQSTGASVLRPFEVAADRVASPFEDAASWFGGLLHAKSDNKKLRKEVDQLRSQAIVNVSPPCARTRSSSSSSNTWRARATRRTTGPSSPA